MSSLRRSSSGSDAGGAGRRRELNLGVVLPRHAPRQRTLDDDRVAGDGGALAAAAAAAAAEAMRWLQPGTASAAPAPPGLAGGGAALGRAVAASLAGVDLTAPARTSSAILDALADMVSSLQRARAAADSAASLREGVTDGGDARDPGVQPFLSFEE